MDVDGSGEDGGTIGGLQLRRGMHSRHERIWSNPCCRQAYPNGARQGEVVLPFAAGVPGIGTRLLYNARIDGTWHGPGSRFCGAEQVPVMKVRMRMADTLPDNGADVVDLCYATSMRRTSRRISQRYDRALAPVGLRATQYAILVTVRSRQPLAVHELGEILDLERTTAGKNIRPLEKRGLVSTAPSDEDRRVRTIRVTEAGEALLAEARPLWEAAQHAVEKQIGVETANRLRDQLNRLDLA